MSGINRRRFLQLAGAGSLAAASAGGAVVLPNLPKAPKLTTNTHAGTFTFRAVAGMPSRPMPSYASYVIQGHIDLNTKTGMVTKSVMAGHPGDMSNIALPGLSRIVRITEVEVRDGMYYLYGVIDDRSQLLRGESVTFEMHIDPASKIARTGFFGTEIQLDLD
ncbi:MAG TPA: twin-arginine translocation signal domain-containing protein [Ktedonobacteraceae bacterium]|jgi:hypothetical protein|nr:twin-arginine translocation signal domain-containing protein [Ktedonobacteraceae bacterium]